MGEEVIIICISPCCVSPQSSSSSWKTNTQITKYSFPKPHVQMTLLTLSSARAEQGAFPKDVSAPGWGRESPQRYPSWCGGTALGRDAVWVIGTFF